MILRILGVFTHLKGNTNAQLTRSIDVAGSLTETCCQPMSTNHFQHFEQPTSIQHITFNKSYFTGHFQLKHVQQILQLIIFKSSIFVCHISLPCIPPPIFFSLSNSSCLRQGLFANFLNSQEAVHWPDFKSLFAQLERGNPEVLPAVWEVWDLIFW